VRQRARRVLLALGLAAATFALYSPVLSHDLVNYDDDYYLLRSPALRLGLTAEGFSWAFTTGYGANWFPLTWLTWMFDGWLYGPEPWGFHLSNLLLHCASTAVLFLALLAATGATGRSLVVAVVFAVHPLHVEPVAWAADRKDALSGLFWMLAIAAYVRYARRPSVGRYLPVALALALGLMSKPMLVTLPFTLLLLDVWPLGRLDFRRGAAGLGRLVLEKVPLLVLSAASAVVTYQVQQAGGAVRPFEAFGLETRIWNALVSYVRYIGKAVWPSGLAVFYPHPGDGLSRATGVLSLLLLLGLTVGLLAAARRLGRPYLAVGWLFFLGTLVPVLGLVQVGEQAMADRYLYVPLIGLAVIVGWGGHDLLQHLRAPRHAGAVLAAAATAAFAAATWTHHPVWKDSVRLFEHALAVTRENAVAHLNLGVALLERGRLDDAGRHLEEALRIHPGAAEALGALGEVRYRQGRPDEARERFAAAVRLDPGLSRVRNAYGRFLIEQGEAEEAIAQLREAIAVDPDYAEPYNNLGAALLAQGSTAEAVDYLAKAAAVDPTLAEARLNWGRALLARGEAAAAIEQFHAAASLRPGDGAAFKGLGLALLRMREPALATERLTEAVSLGPPDPETRKALGMALAQTGRLPDAAAHFEAAAAIDDRDPELHHVWGMALADLGRLPEAIDHYRRALVLQPDYAEVWNALGMAEGNRGRWDAAIDAFRRAAALEPDYAQAFNNWGLAVAQQGGVAEATRLFRRAVEADPDYPDGHNNLGVFLARQGRLAEAEHHFREAVRLDPRHADAAKNLEALRRAPR
jgi:Tfp pilus assembly protein PilF